MNPDLLKQASELRARGESLVLVTVVEKEGEGPAAVGKKLLVTRHAPPVGTVGGGALEHQAIEKARLLLESGTSCLESYSLDQEQSPEEGTLVLPMICGGKVRLFYEYISGGEPVYIFGGGHVGEALCRQLEPLGYFTRIIDDRKDVLDAMEAGMVRHHASFYDFSREHPMEEQSFVLVCTPSHKHDFQVLRGILERGSNPRYIGVLASQKKKAELLEALRKDFGRDIDLSRLYCPVGLDTGGPSPAEIALSIAAEMQCIRYGKSGMTHMRDRR